MKNFLNRSRPKPEWREKNWTSNVFRILELMFGKKTDLVIKNGKEVWVERIKLESAGYGWVDKYGNRGEHYVAYSTEAKIAFVEQIARKYISAYLRKLKRFRIPEITFFDSFMPEFALAGISYIPKTDKRPAGIMFAIALDTSSVGNSSASSQVNIGSYTVTGSNVVMLASVTDQANSGASYATNVTSVTCNATAQNLTKVSVARGDPSYGTACAIWAKLGASSGAIRGNRTSTGDGFQIGVETLSGVDQGTAEASIANNSTGTSGGNISNPQASPSVTSPTNGWVAMSVYISTGAPAATAGSGTTLRQSASGAEYGYLFDSNGLVSGSQTLNIAGKSGISHGIVIVAVGPAGASSPYIPKILGGA
jgi:hypothetical protein